MSRTTRVMLLMLTGMLALSDTSRGQSREPFNLEVGDPARKTKSIPLAVDQIHDTQKGVDVSPDEVAAALSDA